MKLNTLTIQARGRKRRIAFTEPVTIISGPNGAGKSTVLSGVELALVGTVTVEAGGSAPGAPTNPSPGNNVTGVSPSASVGWTAADNAARTTGGSPS